jgi:hypothetical protein
LKVDGEMNARIASDKENRFSTLENLFSCAKTPSFTVVFEWPEGEGSWPVRERRIETDRSRTRGYQISYRTMLH